ncbi:MAG: hypothetical protein JXQ67_09200 [Campylobacterales bacterium]|nr:hypothetical protein [Campylobacterales bacterium]
MKEKITFGLQVLVGILLLVFGFNMFFNFLPMQPGTEQIGAFMGALFQTGYLLPLVGVIYIVVGVSYIANKFVAFTSLLLIPVMLNAFLAHLFLDMAGILPSAFILFVIGLVMCKHRSKYESVFTN